MSSTAGVDTTALMKTASDATARVREQAAAKAAELQDVATAKAGELKHVASAAAERLIEAGAPAEQLSKLQSTVHQFLQLSGDASTLPEAADTEALCSALRERGLLLVKSAESYRQQAEQACERGKAYKTQAKEAQAAAQALQQRVAAALRRIAELEEGGVNLPATPAPVASTPAMEVAATPAFLREAADDLQQQQQRSAADKVDVRIVAASSGSVCLSIVRR